MRGSERSRSMCLCVFLPVRHRHLAPASEMFPSFSIDNLVCILYVSCDAMNHFVSIRMHKHPLTGRQVYAFEHPYTDLQRKPPSSYIFVIFPPGFFQSRRVAGMTADLHSPHRPVRVLSRSAKYFQVSLTRIFPSCLLSSALPFPIISF